MRILQNVLRHGTDPPGGSGYALHVRVCHRRANSCRLRRPMACPSWPGPAYFPAIKQNDRDSREKLLTPDIAKWQVFSRACGCQAVLTDCISARKYDIPPIIFQRCNSLCAPKTVNLWQDISADQAIKF